MGILISLSKEATSLWLNVSECALLLFAIVVVIGLIGEHKLDWWHPRYDLFVVLVVIGCSGEMIADGGVFFFSRHLTAISDTELRDATIKAGDAQDSAGKAANAAKRANDSAQQAELLAKGARKEADSFEKDIVSAKEQAADAESHLADALQRAATAQMAAGKLTEKMADRQLTDAQVEKIAGKIKPFSGQEFRLSTYWNMREPVLIANRIYAALSFAGWTFIRPATSEVMVVQISGVLVIVPEEADGKTKQAASSLVSALNEQGIVSRLQGAPEHPTNRLEINIGTKQ